MKRKNDLRLVKWIKPNFNLGIEWLKKLWYKGYIRKKKVGKQRIAVLTRKGKKLIKN